MVVLVGLVVWEVVVVVVAMVGDGWWLVGGGWWVVSGW
jgi:hypothetical protein